MKPVAILGSGMVSAVGLDAPSSCAAIRVGFSGAKETGFMVDGDWLMGFEVPLPVPWRGREKLLRMAAMAVGECLAAMPDVPAERVACLLCLSEPERPGRPGDLDRTMVEDLERHLSVRFHSASSLLAAGRVGAVHAIAKAGEILARKDIDRCVVIGVDSLLDAGTLAAYQESRRLLTGVNSNGFIPGEAAAAVILGPARNSRERELHIVGLGTGVEKAHVLAEDPLRADGLAAAIREAVEGSGLSFDEICYRVTGDNGEHYGFKEGTLAMARVTRPVKQEFDHWHPAECVGEIGAATMPVILTVVLAACRKGYSKGDGILCHLGNDDGARAALVLKFQTAAN